MSNRSKYPDEMRERAVRMVLDHQHEYSSQWEAIVTVTQMLGPQAETVLKWVRRAEIGRGSRPGRSSEEVEELRRLRRENAELRRANDILEAAASFFGAELDRHSNRRSDRVHRRALVPQVRRAALGGRDDLQGASVRPVEL